MRGDLAAIPVHDALHVARPDADTGKIVLAVQALAGSEQVIRVGHIEACTIVGNTDAPQAADLAPMHANGRCRGGTGVLSGVVQQVGQGAVEHALVALHNKAILDLQCGPPSGLGHGQFGQASTCHRRQVHTILLMIPACASRQGQQAIEKVADFWVASDI